MPSRCVALLFLFAPRRSLLPGWSPAARLSCCCIISAPAGFPAVRQARGARPAARRCLRRRTTGFTAASRASLDARARSPLLCSLVRSRRAPPRQAQVVSLSPPPRPRRHALSFRLSLSRALLQGEWLEGARATTQRERESLAPPRLSLPIGSRERAAVSPWQRGGRGSGAALAAAVATTTTRRMMMPEETL